MKYCQKCGNELESNAAFCSVCGQAILKIDQVATKFCSNCGRKIPATAKYCPNCDVKLSTSSPQTAANQVASLDKPYNESKQPDPVNSFMLLLKDTFKISKRLGRADYWWARLTTTACGLSLMLLWAGNFVRIYYARTATTHIMTTMLILLTVIFSVWQIIAILTADIRRLHDISLSGAFLFLLLIPMVGSVAIFIMTLLPSKQNNNRYI